jgi:hypothetical protein
MDTVPTELPGDATTEAPAASRCPVDHVAMAAQQAAQDAARCPFPHDTVRPVHRTKADIFMRRLLRIRDRPAGVTSAQAYSAFQKSMLISGTRCMLTYVVFPFVLPLLGIAKGVGPVVGIVIGSVAMVCDVFTIRRFFMVDHKYRWYFTAVALSVIGLLTVLLVEDIANFVS